MKYIKTYEDYLDEYSFLYKVNEKKGDSYSYGCVMLFFDFPSLKGIQDLIKEEDLYTESGDRSYGLEDEPHVTILYGLHEEVSKDDVFDLLKPYRCEDLLLTKISAFENSKYDVLKFDVEDAVRGLSYLHKMNKALAALPHTTDFPDYHPHSTIAYLKTGKAKEYIEQLKGTQHIVKPRSFVYSLPSNDKITAGINNSKYISYND
jgi:2'-5' RNA ligase